MTRDRLGRVPDRRPRRYLDATGGNPFLATQVVDGLARSAAGGEPGTAAGGFATAMRAGSPICLVRRAARGAGRRRRQAVPVATRSR